MWLKCQSFRQIVVAFNARAALMRMELHHAYGHWNVLRFSELKSNPSLSPQLFKFVPRNGADVLGK